MSAQLLRNKCCIKMSIIYLALLYNNFRSFSHKHLFSTRIFSNFYQRKQTAHNIICMLLQFISFFFKNPDLWPPLLECISQIDQKDIKTLRSCDGCLTILHILSVLPSVLRASLQGWRGCLRAADFKYTLPF